MSGILTKIDDRGVGAITLNRPEHHNAFNDVVISDINNALAHMKQEKVRVLVINSTGKSFSAGADLAWMQRMVNFSLEENIQDAKHLGELFFNLYHFPAPTIALVQGAAMGGGAGLVACCKIAIATNDAQFSFPEVKLGLIPSLISPYIVNAIGARNAMAYSLSGLPFSADKAEAMGLCQEVCTSAVLGDRGNFWINAFLQNGPLAMQAIPILLSQYQMPINQVILNTTTEIIAKIRVSSEAQEGLKARLEKRQPAWIKT